ncbi:hypothetical protein LEP1GSC202_2364 [Leptospira yanagawae serovar Saopaulo str. Sao Paulo = ATCC 700523]|uniref:Lipoprotein n=2 Tax=Leptospira yanagawae TaxID=293069 RepID=A0A5E8H8D2_9LEPT|nr:hypothetical protein LEP1GSC202_2364 [Leptospira yanagawae serovar Saopaulo str. Sao Paulo = ATCC 700523]
MTQYMKKIILNPLFFFFLFNCAFDIRQLPSPKKIDFPIERKNKNILNIGDFEILNSDLKEIESAWRYIFISYMNNDVSITNKYFITDNEMNQNAINLDVKIRPILIENRNHWWSLPIIYPATLFWPFHFRKIDYNISVDYTISKSRNIILSDTFEINNEETIYFYGLTRTFIFEEFIEDSNKKALDKCISKISLQLFQL